MNLLQAKTRAIQAINEFSVNGALVLAAKNADYMLRMASFADYAQNEISDKVGIDATLSINSATTIDANQNFYNKFNLPTNYKDHRHVLYKDEPFYEYRIENNQLWVSDVLVPDYTLVYYRYPTTIDDSTADTYVFEVDAYTHSIIPYYMGGMVIADENAEISNKLLNIYYERLGQARKRRVNYPKTVRLTTRW